MNANGDKDLKIVVWRGSFGDEILALAKTDNFPDSRMVPNGSADVRWVR